MNPTQIHAAIKSMKLKSRKTRDMTSGNKSWPSCGMVFVYLRGNWDAAPIGAQYKHTHWVATINEWTAATPENPAGGNQRHVYDVNAGRWLPISEWIADVLSVIGEKQKATGWKTWNAIQVFG